MDCTFGLHFWIALLDCTFGLQIRECNDEGQFPINTEQGNFMDYTFEKDWMRLEQLMESRFGEPPDLTTMIFTVGLQECGQAYRNFKKDEKVAIMHVGVCTLLEPLGFYKALGTDEEGWPHFERTSEIPAVSKQEQELLMKRALVDYFAAWIAGG
ncbi:MAG: hypothetical protein O2818_01620 [Bacteroidetes bacterium]|nr:hypothetical protein [Bacteroidota bacterium]